ncbi:transcription factor DIVARICATA-like [Mangifera indica]|uniref:transcription factor DIVARICATA-like n=1 Tax=Mangifera indica TaxID=29780 RepID=UPI001CFA6344|nr:transcription factor DIVARICATA-like [Mangifera indica]
MYQDANPFHSSSTHWNRLEDKLFEHALILFPDEVPDRWQKIADQLPGKSPRDVEEHYEVLVHDVAEINSGRVELPCYSDESSCWDSASQISFGSKPVKQSEPERKKGTPWTEAEHRLFLIGLRKFGKGDWRSISRSVVVSRTPTQVASHAQKYFLRQTNVRKERKRASIHDITTVDTKPIDLPVEQNSMGLPIDQNWNPSQEVPVHHEPPTYQQFPPPNQFPSQGGAMGYQNYGFPM